jgi:hypothetical protein
MPFAGNLRTLPLPDVFQTLNNIKATGVLRLRSNAGSRDVVFQQGEIIGVGFLDKEGREDLELRLSLLGIEQQVGERMKGVTWYWTAMQARVQTSRAEMDELVHEQAREQLHNLFAWATADFAFDESGPGKTVANELVARSLEPPPSCSRRPSSRTNGPSCAPASATRPAQRPWAPRRRWRRWRRT